MKIMWFSCVSLAVVFAVVGFVRPQIMLDNSNKSVNSPSQEPFEAAFQGECREDAPCQQLCFDLHDGTFECGCKNGYTLFADGYTCMENSEYELLWSLNLTLDDKVNKAEFKPHIFHYALDVDRKKPEESYVLNKESPDPRARTLSQSENRPTKEFILDFGKEAFYKPEIVFPKDVQHKEEDKNRLKKKVESVDKRDGVKVLTKPLIDSPAQSETMLGMTTMPSLKHVTSCLDFKCQNGGTCLPEGENAMYRCQCPIGWAGKFCEIVEEIRYPRFVGHSYLSLRVKTTSSATDFSMELEFRPELYEGNLLYVGNVDNPFEDVFCTLVMRNGIIEVRYHDGNRNGFLRSENPVVLNSWNHIKISFDDRKGLIQLNDNPVREKPAEKIASSMNKVETVFLGSFPNSSKTPSSGYQGCVRKFLLNDYSFNFQPTANDDVREGADLEECRPGVCNTVSCKNGGQCAAVHPNWGTCLCPLGFAGAQCENAVDVVIPSFDGTAHLQFPGLASTSLTFTEILLVFLPRSPNGSLLYNGYRINGTGDFLSLTLSSGFLTFRFDLGTGVNEIRSPNPVTMKQWHKVLITRTGRLGALQVDNEPPLRVLSRGGYSQLSLPLNLFLGGMPSPKELASSAEVLNSFVGCIQKMVINGKNIKLVEQALSGVNINNCDHPCTNKPCLNSGTCTPILQDFSCTCGTGYTGPHCSTEIVDMVKRPMFLGTSYLHYVNDHILSRFRGQSLQLSLSFRALSPFGLILWAGDRQVDSSSDYLALGLYDGHLRLDYNLGSGPVSLFYNHSRVDDGFWHDIKVVRFKQRGSMTVDGTRTVTAVSPGPLKELNIPNELFVGGMPEISRYTAGIYRTGLMGCLSGFTIDTNFKVQFLTMAVTGIYIQPCV